MSSGKGNCGDSRLLLPLMGLLHLIELFCSRFMYSDCKLWLHLYLAGRILTRSWALKMCCNLEIPIQINDFCEWGFSATNTRWRYCTHWDKRIQTQTKSNKGDNYHSSHALSDISKEENELPFACSAWLSECESIQRELSTSLDPRLPRIICILFKVGSLCVVLWHVWGLEKIPCSQAS